MMVRTPPTHKQARLANLQTIVISVAATAVIVNKHKHSKQVSKQANKQDKEPERVRNTLKNPQDLLQATHGSIRTSNHKKRLEGRAEAGGVGPPQVHSIESAAPRDNMGTGRAELHTKAQTFMTISSNHLPLNPPSAHLIPLG